MTLLTGCNSTTVIKIPTCSYYDYIYPSRTDTLDTQKQVLIHNEAHEACLAASKSAD